jgi:hypothetical protein
MTQEVVAEIEAQVRELREGGQVPEGLEDELDECFEKAAEAALAGVPGASIGPGGGAAPVGRLGASWSPTGLRKQLTVLARRRLGPSLRRAERQAVLGVARAGETAWLQVHVSADHLERLAGRSALASRVLSVLRPRELAIPASRSVRPVVEGPLLDWVLERLGESAAGQLGSPPAPVLHAECGDGRVLQALASTGLEVRGADPRLSARSRGDTSIVAAGALEYLGATPQASLGGILLTGIVDRLRPGAARALAELAARCLVPGGIVVLVSARPELVVAMDPVAADLASGRPMHPVTWCHLLAYFGLSELTVFGPDAAEPEVFAVSARRPLHAPAPYRLRP